MRSPDHNSNRDDQGVAASGESFYAALSDIGQLLVRSLDPAVLYEAVIEVLQRRIGAMLVMIGEVDRESGMFRRIAPSRISPGMQDIYPERLPFALAQLSFWQGTPQLETDVRNLAGLEPFRQAYVRHDVMSSIAVPVMKFGEVRAGLVIRSAHAGFFSPAMIELLRQAAANIGLGLEAHEQRKLLLQSVRDEARQRRALRLLSEMVKVVTHSVDEPGLLADACRVVRQTGDYPAAWIGLLDRHATNTLRTAACEDGTNSSSIEASLDMLDPAHMDDAVMTAMRGGQSSVKRLKPGGAAPRPFSGVNHDLHSMLALPLRVDGALIGVLVMGAANAHVFSSVETQVFSEMAVELGLGIQMQRARAARLMAESDLRFNLQHFRTVLANQYAGILVMAQNGRVKFANDAFCKLFKLSETPAELEGSSMADMFMRLKAIYEHPEKEWQRIQQILSRNEVVRGDQVSMSDGRIFLRDFTPITIDDEPQGWLWHQRDITEQKMHEARVERLAFYDVVTGLPNRRLLFELLEQARSRAGAQHSLLAVGVLDLDRFKNVNDTVGHGGGDRVLAEASARILGMLREADVLARFGGDEFALVIPGLDSREQLEVISRCVLQALRAPFHLADEQLHLSASIGWTLYPLDDSDAEGLVRHADLAMYVAKEDGKDRDALYEPAMELEQVRLQAMRDRFAQALKHAHLKLLFQPIVYIDGLPGSNGVAGMEALLRLHDTDEGLVEPVDFMHVLDDPQLARPIGRYVLDEALRQCQTWMRHGLSLPVSVNISTRHLLHPAFFSDIDAALESYPKVMDVGFGIEVTETGPMMDHARAKIVIEECRRRGIRVGLDDFGTGSASLSHIQQLDIEHIKLDQSFVKNILSDERNMAIAAGVITTARLLAKTVIAEGVETAEQGDLLASLGCHQLQGFSISRPMPGPSVPNWVARWIPPSSWGRLVGERRSQIANRKA
ncbi:EAL domain-containing protein [Rhodanobacter sp. L36]|uniref:bifunctional diguanylate cyclase/phosphodiesterase n=1 Tax=Rhodanobacter sp. L36 TaxID=1747221 RepID=UPI00131B73A3|nr:EAL domain-containing protein [Rhodanobacter sp. L36]